MDAFSFEAELWEWDAKASWFFVTVPQEVSDIIEEITEGLTGGFGSVKVDVTIGSSNWLTSVFPSTEMEAYVLPIKKTVRTKEGIEVGDTCVVDLRLARRP